MARHSEKKRRTLILLKYLNNFSLMGHETRLNGDFTPGGDTRTHREGAWVNSEDDHWVKIFQSMLDQKREADKSASRCYLRSQ